MLGPRPLRTDRGWQTLNTRSKQTNKKHTLSLPLFPILLPVAPTHRQKSLEQSTGKEDGAKAPDLARCKVNIAAPSETRLAEQGQLEEDVYGPTAKGTAPLLTLLTEKTQLPQRGVEHSSGVLSHPSTITDAAIARLSQVKTNVNLDLPPSPTKS
nr:unnamed protein product [Spirometra erinaceieuropaei]